MRMPISQTLKSMIFCVMILNVLNAKASSPITYEGRDISPIVEYFGKQVVTLKRPIFVYNWSPAGTKGDGLGLFSKAQRSADSYWKSFGNDSVGNVFGLGLYAAVDPLISVDFGQSKSDQTKPILETALLLQMQLPKGFRFVDLSRTDKPSRNERPQDLKELITSFGCLESQLLDTYSPSYLGTFLGEGGSPQPKSCQKLILKVLKDILHIDGFSYDYYSSDFKACEKDGFYNGRAFVITRSEWMRPDLIQFFNRNSKHDLENRRIIQTLFLNQANEALQDDSALSPNSMYSDQISNYLDLHPISGISEERIACDLEICTLTVRFCETSNNSLQCEDVRFTHPIPPGDKVILANDAHQTPFQDLFWADLEGQPKAKDVDTWLKENLFGCNGESPYKESL